MRIMRLPDDISLKILRNGGEVSQRFLTLLSEEERIRLATFKHAARRSSFILGRAAARLVTGDRLAIDPAEVRLEVAPDGAVDVIGVPYHVSISHGGEMAAAAIAQCAVGVDLEKIIPRNPRLLSRILSDTEREAAGAIPLAPEVTAVLYWTLKEAVVKGMRTGLRCPMASIETDLDYEAGEGLVVAGSEKWEVRFRELDGYFIAVAWER